MNSYPSASAVQVIIDLSSVALESPTTATYRVLDEEGIELLASAAVSGYTAGDTEATVVVDVLENTLADGATFGAREIQVVLSNGTSTETVRSSYRLYANAILQVPKNSFMTLTMAEMLAEEVVGLSYWTTADEDSRTKCLLHAFTRLSVLLARDTTKYARDYAGYDSDFAGHGMSSGSVFRIADLSVSEWDATSPEFKRAFRLAQLVEVDNMLNPGSASDGNVRSIVIGESSRTFFIPTKSPASLPAMKYLARFLASPRVGRG